MTIPTTIIFPLKTDITEVGDFNVYLNDLTFRLQRMYEDLANVVNGSFSASVLTDNQLWTPFLRGTTVPGNFTYTHQVGWALRQGLITDIWFDIAWTSAGGATGNLFLELPYQVFNADEKPFSSALQTSTIAYGAGKTVLSINAIPETIRGEIWSSGSGVTTTNVAVVAAGQLIGHIRYIGDDSEA